MSSTYQGILIMALSALLPRLGVEIANDTLTTTVSVLFVIAGALWAARGRYRLGGVNLIGLRTTAQ